MKDIAGAEVSVIGVGKSGIYSSQLLKDKGARVFVSDSRDIRNDTLDMLRSFEIDFEAGGHTEKCLRNKDFIVVSPGVSLKTFPIDEARKRGIPVYGEVEVASWFINVPTVAITGTNGKSTTATLIGEMLKAMGRDVVVCGNIGLPLSRVAIDNKSDIVVIEVSSFQLETVREFRPHISVLLNITPNHLDRYSGDISAYARAKANLFRNQGRGDYAILNADDEKVREIPLPSGVRRIYFSIEGNRDRAEIYLNNGRCISCMYGKEEILFSYGGLKLPGRHNLANVLAACGVAMCISPHDRRWDIVLTHFNGLPHRLEKVREIGGIMFINDSKSTSVDATLKAIQSISAPIILIAGGRDKGSPFDMLREEVSRKVKRLILIGEAREKIASMLDGATSIHKFNILREAVLFALRSGVPGDCVLFSPACSSFDMFKNFEERGEVFKKIVLSISGNNQP